MIVAGRPKVRKKINCTRVDDTDTHMLGHGMDLRGSWQEPVAGVVDTVRSPHKFCLYKLKGSFLTTQTTTSFSGMQFTSSIYFRAHLVIQTERFVLSYHF